MGVTVAELAERMSSLEFTYHQVAERVAPRGEREADRRAALISAQIADWSGYAKSNSSIEGNMARLEKSRLDERQSGKRARVNKRRQHNGGL